MPTSPDRLEELKIQLRKELERSIIIEPADRQFWLSNLDTLPLPTIQNLLKILRPKNDAVESMMETALAQDKNEEHLKALRTEVARIKQNAFQLEEKSEHQTEEKAEEELLKQLDDV